VTSDRWAVFLDRDGTMVPDRGWTSRPRDLEFYRATGEGLRLLKDAGALLIVVSNQSGIARGIFDTDALRRMDRRLLSLARRERAPLAAAYYCPHHPDWTGPCRCRKPAPGMLRNAIRRFRLDPRRCFLVGDSVSDLAAGKALRCTTVLVLTGHGRRAARAARRGGLADHVGRDLVSAARWILARREGRLPR
jgi:D-glycero-D-manno-heptose 1,7-bisphosphate phosphatase